MNDLIDTTEMYLRTIFELEEEDRPAARAHRGAAPPERSHRQPDGRADGARRPARRRGRPAPAAVRRGRQLATAVMRKHRLAECLLVDVIGLDYADVHEEACRWEHVMSEAVERKLLTLLGNPSVSPFGNPIPGWTPCAVSSRSAARRRRCWTP